MLFGIKFNHAGYGSLADRAESICRICLHTAVRERTIDTFRLISCPFIYCDKRFLRNALGYLFPYASIKCRCRYLDDLRKHIFPFRSEIMKSGYVLLPWFTMRIVILDKLVVIVVLISKAGKAMSELMYDNRLESLMMSSCQSI